MEDERRKKAYLNTFVAEHILSFFIPFSFFILKSGRGRGRSRSRSHICSVSPLVSRRPTRGLRFTQNFGFRVETGKC